MNIRHNEHLPPRQKHELNSAEIKSPKQGESSPADNRRSEGVTFSNSGQQSTRPRPTGWVDQHSPTSSLMPPENKTPLQAIASRYRQKTSVAILTFILTFPAVCVDSTNAIHATESTSTQDHLTRLLEVAICSDLPLQRSAETGEQKRAQTDGTKNNTSRGKPDSSATSTAGDNQISSEPITNYKVKIIRDEIYQSGVGRAGQCDIFMPDPLPLDSKLPPVILVHGGGWVGGDKWNLKSYAYQLAEKGFFALTINYRHAPKHRFPAQVDDVRLAMLWLKGEQNRFQVDMNRLGMFGYSAGGHLTALVCSIANQNIRTQSSTSHWETEDTRWQQLPEVQAMCIGGPPCNFQSLPPDNTSMKFFLGDSRRNAQATYLAASPLAHVSKGDPPTMIIHGETDIMVPMKGSQIFHDAQVAAGIDSQLKILPKQGHFLTFLNPETATQMILHFQQHLIR